MARPMQSAFPCGHPEVYLRVWFDRCGHSPRGWIVFDEDRREVDPEIMATQGWLQAGNLQVELRLPVSEVEAEALRTHDFLYGSMEGSSPEYEGLAKRILKLITPK